MPFLYKHIEISDRVVLLWLDPEHRQTNPHVDKNPLVWTSQLHAAATATLKQINYIKIKHVHEGTIISYWRFQTLNQSDFAFRTNLLPEKKNEYANGKRSSAGSIFTSHIDWTPRPFMGLYFDLLTIHHYSITKDRKWPLSVKQDFLRTDWPIQPWFWLHTGRQVCICIFIAIFIVMSDNEVPN